MLWVLIENRLKLLRSLSESLHSPNDIDHVVVPTFPIKIDESQRDKVHFVDIGHVRVALFTVCNTQTNNLQHICRFYSVF